MADSFECVNKECNRHPSKGDTITRISPKGTPFEGACDEHFEMEQDLYYEKQQDMMADAIDEEARKEGWI
jgi:hypothetical protein